MKLQGAPVLLGNFVISLKHLRINLEVLRNPSAMFQLWNTITVGGTDRQESIEWTVVAGR